MNKKEIRLMIVDDHKMIRDGIKLMLKSNPEIKLIAEAENGLEAVKYIDNNPKALDVVLMDISMPKLNGIDATKDIKAHHKHINILAITMHLEESYITDMMKAGASGYILKESGKEDLIEAILKVAEGKLYFTSEVSSIIIGNMMNNDSTNHTKSIISDREKEVIKYVAQGISNIEIGEKLNLSARTIESHRRNILQKLDLKNTAEMISYAIKHHWV
ncbi:MAG: response regulator transcription factor [Bacteroidetes bacterium]|nr:response regulator transcription factor [Bacteroidota bacterium]